MEKLFSIYTGVKMIKAVIFDWGGVLIDDPCDGIYSYCANALGTDKKSFWPAFYKNEVEFQTGKITEKELWKRVCKKLGIKEPGKAVWKDAFASAYREKKEVFSVIKKLKANGYKIGFLSNTEKPGMELFKEQNYSFFDATVFSCKEGIHKPDERIYKIAAERLGIKPKEAVFVDNKEENVKGAEDAGMKGIVFMSPRQMCQELVKIGVKLPL